MESWSIFCEFTLLGMVENVQLHDESIVVTLPC